MKKLLFSLLAMTCAFSSWADPQDAQISSNPSPAVSNKPLEVTIITGDMGSEVYCYTWCNKVVGEPDGISPWNWNDVHTSKFKMEGSNGTYKLTISSIKDFYGLTDSQLEGLSELGFIAKTSSGTQTKDLLVSVVQGRRDAYSGGEGTADNPFILKTASDIMTLAATPGDWAAGTYLKMEANIEIPDLRSTIGTAATPFSGSFDGNGHTISDLHLSIGPFGTPVGLFGVISGGEIKNLGIVASTVYGTTCIGMLAGQLNSGLIERCYTAGNVGGTSICVGGLVGENVAGTIRNCYSGVTVGNANDYATGGLVGKNRGSILNTYACGYVTGLDYVGGLVGANYGTVKNSFALNGAVTGSQDFVARFGGNNNSQNSASDTYSWEDMASYAHAWTQQAHHAEMKKSTEFRDEEAFKALSGWDFNDIWEWRKEGTKEYAVLKGLHGQTGLLPEEYFLGTTGVAELDGSENVMLSIGPNPTEGSLLIQSSEEIEIFELYSLSGMLTMQGRPAAAAATLDLSALADGLYVLRIVTADGRDHVNKIIKK